MNILYLCNVNAYIEDYCNRRMRRNRLLSQARRWGLQLCSGGRGLPRNAGATRAPTRAPVPPRPSPSLHQLRARVRVQSFDQ